MVGHGIGTQFPSVSKDENRSDLTPLWVWHASYGCSRRIGKRSQDRNPPPLSAPSG